MGDPKSQSLNPKRQFLLGSTSSGVGQFGHPLPCLQHEQCKVKERCQSKERGRSIRVRRSQGITCGRLIALLAPKIRVPFGNARATSRRGTKNYSLKLCVRDPQQKSHQHTLLLPSLWIVWLSLPTRFP